MKIVIDWIPAVKCAELCRWLIAHIDAVIVRDTMGSAVGVDRLDGTLELLKLHQSSPWGSMTAERRRFDVTIEGDDDTIMFIKMKFL